MRRHICSRPDVVASIRVADNVFPVAAGKILLAFCRPGFTSFVFRLIFVTHLVRWRRNLSLHPEFNSLGRAAGGLISPDPTKVGCAVRLHQSLRASRLQFGF